MLIFITVLMVNVWAIPADDLFTPNINIIEELEKMGARMKYLENVIERLTENTANIVTGLRLKEEREKVAFSASLSASTGVKYIGPYAEATNLVYEHAFTNIGNAYDINTGVFTAPVKGVYFFNFVVFNPYAISTGVRLLKNGDFVVAASDNPPGQDTEDTACNSLSLFCWNKGTRYFFSSYRTVVSTQICGNETPSVDTFFLPFKVISHVV